MRGSRLVNTLSPVLITDTSLSRVIYSGLHIPHLVNRSFTRLVTALFEPSLCLPCKICLIDYVTAEVSWAITDVQRSISVTFLLVALVFCSLASVIATVFRDSYWLVHRWRDSLPPGFQHLLPGINSVVAKHSPSGLRHRQPGRYPAVSAHWHPLPMGCWHVWPELTNQLLLIVHQPTFTTRLFRVVLWVGAVTRHGDGLTSKRSNRLPSPVIRALSCVACLSNIFKLLSRFHKFA